MRVVQWVNIFSMKRMAIPFVYMMTFQNRRMVIVSFLCCLEGLQDEKRIQVTFFTAIHDFLNVLQNFRMTLVVVL
jgi:hypothetical protein